MLTGDKGPKGDKGDDDCCSGCQNWSEWNPDPNQVCDGENFWQNRYCLDNSGVGSGIGSGGGGGGGLQYEWRSATGTAIPNWGPWTPDPSTVCDGVSFTQTSTDLNGACGNRYQSETGTSVPNWGPWGPDPSTVCDGITFTQTSTDLNGKCTTRYQSSIGIKQTILGPWTPDPSTVCEGVEFTQTKTDINNCQPTQTQEAVGTKIVTPNWSEWSPDTSTVCVGTTFTQSRNILNQYELCVGVDSPEFRQNVGTKTVANYVRILSITSPNNHQLATWYQDSWYGQIYNSRCVSNIGIWGGDYAVGITTNNYWPGSSQVGPHGNICATNCTCEIGVNHNLAALIRDPNTELPSPGWMCPGRYQEKPYDAPVPEGMLAIQAWGTAIYCGNTCCQYSGTYALIPKNGIVGASQTLNLEVFMSNCPTGNDIIGCANNPYPVQITYEYICI